jgi:integrase
MANKTGHRRFGSVRRRRSGRWQARYQGPDGQTRSAPRTFDSRRSAEQWLTLMEGRILRGEWQPSEQSKMMFGGYATHWLVDRRLEPRSRELYAMLLRLHLMPWFGDLALDRITPPIVRSWRTELLRLGRSESTAVKSYRLLRAILNTAVKDDRLLRENPCRMRGFDKEPTSERPTASVDQVWRLAALMPRRFRALVIFAAFTGLRWGELVALRVRDVDLDTEVVNVVRKFAELQNGERVPGRPKSVAGFRTVALPSVLVAVVREHLAEFPPSDPEDLIFNGPKGAALRRNNFHRSARWAECVAKAGLPQGFRFHDLRHTGNTLAASSGASTRELMHRMGHASMRAALIYQHATSKRDREIAAAIDARIGRGDDS